MGFLFLLSLGEFGFTRKRTVESDFSVLYATAPISGYSKGIFGLMGFSAGTGFDLTRGDTVFLNLRFDFAFIGWKNANLYGYSNDSYIRMPIFLGLRTYFELSEGILSYIEAGPEFSIEGGAKSSLGRNKFGYWGVTCGGGINFLFMKYLIIGVNARYHFISNPYFHVGPVLGTTW